MKNLHPAITCALRLAIMLAALALVFLRISWGDIWPLLSQIPAMSLVAALLAIHATQILAALRMRFYVAAHNIVLPPQTAVQLHYIGEMFSAVLPGGAGGDVYKAWWLQRHRQGGIMNMAKLMISSRLNGLWALGAIVCILATFDGMPDLQLPVRMLAAAALVAGTVFCAVFMYFVFRESWRHQTIAALYSLALQSLLAFAVWMICLGLQLQAHAVDYIILYMLSCIVALLPISIGGIGVRELVLLHGSMLLHLEADKGVALAFALTIINLTVPLAGAIIQIFWRVKIPQDAPMTIQN